jgi:GNAT superfamily N-acetyltransferase
MPIHGPDKPILKTVAMPKLASSPTETFGTVCARGCAGALADFAARFLPHEVRIIVEGDRDIGWLQVSETDAEIFLKQMFLQPASQEKGIGSRLLADIIERGRQTKKPVRLGVVKSIRRWVSISALALRSRRRTTSSTTWRNTLGELQ